MKFKPIHLEKNNQLAVDYQQNMKTIQRYFHYRPFGEDERRLTYIDGRTYQRQALSDVLLQMNRKWHATDSTIDQIKRLQLQDSTVVIGGQQAGLLTGPLYTVNKVISVVRLAREKEAHLNRPVIPVFWIAGEDHDFAEINHIFSVKNHHNYKHTIKQEDTIGKSVSDMNINQNAARKWLQQFLNDMPETHYTPIWYEETLQSLAASKTYTDFFARLIYQLFPDAGIVLVDAHDQALRKLESAYFTTLIEQQPEVTNHVYNDLQQLQHQGYPIPLDVGANDANLFYHGEDGERILLVRNGDQWIGKHEEVMKTTTEMLGIAEKTPWLLSTNVITRPMMQEFLFPTLAFVAGDGEISYWATLKNAFETVGLKVPPVVARLSFTYVTLKASKLLKKRALHAEDVIQNGTGAVKQRWLFAQQSAPLDMIFAEAKESIGGIHAPLRQYADSISPDLGNEAKKNMQYIERQLDYLQHRMVGKMQDNYKIALSHFETLENMLHPNGTLQERIWNPYMLINRYGNRFLQEMLATDALSFEHQHYVIFLDE